MKANEVIKYKWPIISQPKGNYANDYGNCFTNDYAWLFPHAVCGCGFYSR